MSDYPALCLVQQDSGQCQLLIPEIFPWRTACPPFAQRAGRGVQVQDPALLFPYLSVPGVLGPVFLQKGFGWGQVTWGLEVPIPVQCKSSRWKWEGSELL